MTQQKVRFVSLGCAKNLVDTEVMAAKLAAADWALTADENDADTIVVNTCAFIDAAKQESTETLLELAAQKRSGQQLIVAGCLAQRFGDQLQALVPEIDGVIGTGAYAGIVELLEDVRAGERPVRLHLDAQPEHDFLPRLVTTPRATAYLKIAEGCDHPCTFCIIPQLRGRFRSRSEESIVKEATALVRAGAKELILIAQDSSMWGRDRGVRRGGLAQLLERLHQIERLEWIRLLYLYPATVDAELVDAIASLPKVCKYVDMPLQHTHPEILRKMLRPSNGDRYLRMIEDLRARIPDLTVRSTFIVGFPGESQQHVDHLAAWIERAELDRVGFFEYSREHATPAAELSDQVPAKVKRRRLIRLREAQRHASQRARNRRVGRVTRVLVEEERRLRRTDPLRQQIGRPTAWFGRSMGEAPGVDGGIYFTGAGAIGGFAEVRLDWAGPFDYAGRSMQTGYKGNAQVASGKLEGWAST